MARFTARHVQDAFTAIRRDGVPGGFRDSTKWDIIDELTNERFPPKAVLFLAKVYAGDESPSGGGGDRGTNNALRERHFRVVLKPHLELSDEAADIQAVLSSSAGETTKQQLISARLGQGGFRAELVELWAGKCALTQLGIAAVLRASHIKPWRESDDAERLNPLNGLLLAANLDALFDRYLISFDESGYVLACSSLKRSLLAKAGLCPGDHIELKSGNHMFLKWHRAKFEERSGSAYLF